MRSRATLILAAILSLVALGVAGFFGFGRGTEEPTPRSIEIRFQSREIASIGENDEAFLSDDGLVNIQVRATPAGKQVYVNGQAGPSALAFDQFSLSRDGSAVYYRGSLPGGETSSGNVATEKLAPRMGPPGRESGRFCVFRNSTPGTIYQAIPYFVASADRNHFAYWGREGDDWYLERDGVSPLGPFANPDSPEACSFHANMEFSPDQARFYALARIKDRGGWALILDGRVIAKAQEIRVQGFSPSNQLNYSCYEKGSYRWFTDGELVEASESIDCIVDGAKGQRAIISKRSDNSRYQLIYEGKIVQTADWIHSALFRADGQLCYLMTDKNIATVVCGDKRSGPYEHIQELIPSEDRRSVAFYARKGQKWQAGLNGVVGPWYDNINSLKISPDGQKLAYLAAHNAPGKPHWEQQFMVVDGREESPYRVIDGNLRWAPDSSHIAYFARQSEKWVVVCAGKEQKQYDSLARRPELVFDSRGDAIYLATREGKEVLVCGSKEMDWSQGTRILTPWHFDENRRSFVFGAKVGTKLQWTLVNLAATESK